MIEDHMCLYLCCKTIIKISQLLCSFMILGKICGTKLPLNDVISTGNQVLLRFTSDESTNGKGFNMTWTSRRHVTETGRYRTKLMELYVTI